MICKNRVLPLVLCMVMTEPGRAQTELTQITSASDSTELVDGGLYLFSSDVVIEKKRYGYTGCHISKSTYRPADHIIYYMGGPSLFSLRFLLLFPEVTWYVCIKAERTVMEIASI
jgi:hypothetical protein